MSVNVRPAVEPVFLDGELCWGCKAVLVTPEDEINIICQKVPNGVQLFSGIFRQH